MIFNEILIPQDPFTKTNVTRKKSIVGSFQLFSKTQLLRLLERVIFFNDTTCFSNFNFFYFKHVMHNFRKYI